MSQLRINASALAETLGPDVTTACVMAGTSHHYRQMQMEHDLKLVTFMRGEIWSCDQQGVYGMEGTRMAAMAYRLLTLNFKPTPHPLSLEIQRLVGSTAL